MSSPVSILMTRSHSTDQSVVSEPMPRRARVGVFGGTFDPIHIGHLAAASEVMHVARLDRVIFVPAVPSHKPVASVTAAEHRYAMTVLATATNPRFTVSRVDLERGRPSYTIDTLTDIRATVGADVDLVFITGADVVAQLPTWRDADRLVELASFVGVTRSGVEMAVPAEFAAAVSTVSLPDVAMSSSEIRRRLAADEPVWYWLPEAVLAYIRSERLYGTDWERPVGRVCD
jgi:nicotinate-nucleotide adenylyltransferase